ncbi:MAG: hypothetical protein U0900_03990 [Myxococcota bacterium]
MEPALGFRRLRRIAALTTEGVPLLCAGHPFRFPIEAAFRVRENRTMTGEFRWPLSGLLIGSLALSGLTFASASSAAVVDVVGGHLSIVYDGAVFANPSNSSFGLVAADGDFMRYGRFWSAAETVGSAPFYFARQPAEFRPLAATTTTGTPREPNFRDNRNVLDPLYPVRSPEERPTVNGAGPVPSSAGRNRIPTDLAFDPADLVGTVEGLVQTNGVSAWWFANDAVMDAGVAWIGWGDLSLRYDPTRVVLGYSGWVFANQLGGIGDVFDTRITTLVVSDQGLYLEGDLYGSDGTSSDPYNENLETWPSYTLMDPDLEIGTFRFNGITSVPEPSAGLPCGTMSLFLAFVRRRMRSADR